MFLCLMILIFFCLFVCFFILSPFLSAPNLIKFKSNAGDLEFCTHLLNQVSKLIEFKAMGYLEFCTYLLVQVRPTGGHK